MTESSNQKFPFRLDLRIDWSEQDLFGHVNNVSFFKYIQAARVNLWEHTGVLSEFNTHQKGPMLASCKCDFKAPLYYPGELIIYSAVSFIKNSSFGLSHIFESGNETLVAEATDIVVMYDFNAREKMFFPPKVRESLEKALVE